VHSRSLTVDCAVVVLSRCFRAIADDCKPCYCPGNSLLGDVNTTVVTCRSSRDRQYVCDTCAEGHIGDHCELCDDGFFGIPTYPLVT
jgi:hypothetical protein